MTQGMTKKLKIKNWTNCIQDRKNWKLYVEKAKTFKELKLYRLKKKKKKKKKMFRAGLLLIIRRYYWLLARSV
jgi:hypothetical protein